MVTWADQRLEYKEKHLDKEGKVVFECNPGDLAAVVPKKFDSNILVSSGKKIQVKEGDVLVVKKSGEVEKITAKTKPAGVAG